MVIRGRIYSDDFHKDELEKIKQRVSWFAHIICVEWNDSDIYHFKEQGIRDVMRFGHLSTLRFIEVPRIDVPDKVKIDDEWLIEFCVSAAAGDKRYDGYLFFE